MLNKLLFFSFKATASLFVAAVVFALSFSQDKGINQRSTDGKKQGKWIYLGKDRPEEGYPLEGKIEEGVYEDDRKEGLWIKYHNDGKTPKLKGNYTNNRPSGHYVKYFANGKVKEVGNFVQNQYQDSLKRYHENGKLMYEAKYNASGKEHGTVRYYYPNGQLEFEFTSVNGTSTGKAVRYYENGDVKEVIEYGSDGSLVSTQEKEMVNPEVKIKESKANTEQAPKAVNPIVKNGKFQPNGYNKIYNQSDEIWQDGDFKEGRLYNGKVYIYDTDGILLKVKVFKNGLYHSDGQL